MSADEGWYHARLRNTVESDLHDVLVYLHRPWSSSPLQPRTYGGWVNVYTWVSPDRRWTGREYVTRPGYHVLNVLRETWVQYLVIGEASTPPVDKPPTDNA